MSTLAESVSMAILAIRLRADESSDPAAVRRVLDASAIHLTSALGEDTHAPLADARKALVIVSDPIAYAAYWVSFAATSARCVRIDTDTIASDLEIAATVLARSVAT